MRALAHSDRLLSDVLAEIHGARHLTGRKAEAAKEQLRKSIQVEGVGSDFFEIRYRSTQPEGMGRTLEIVTARILESMMSKEVSSSTAMSFVQGRIDKRVAEADAALRYLGALRAYALGKGASERWDSGRIQREIEAQLELKRQAEEKLLHVKASLMKAPLSSVSGATPNGAVAIPRRVAERTGSSSERTTVDVKPMADPIAALETHVLVHGARVKLLGSIKSSIGDGLVTPAAWDQLTAAAERQLAAAERARRDWPEIIANKGGGRLEFIRAPEWIVVVDPPRNPERPMLSNTVIATIVLLSGLLFGVGLTALAELADTRVRTVDRLNAISGLPVLGAIPWSPPEGTPVHPQQDKAGSD